MFMKTVKNVLITTSILGACQAMEPQSSPIPSKFAVYQQEGATCPFICWDNLRKVEDMRARGNGSIQFQDEDYATKIQSYAWFLPRIRTYDRAYTELRNNGGPYAAYESDLRRNGIRSDSRFTEDGTNIEEMDWNPLNKARRKAYVPYNIKVEFEIDEDSGEKFQIPQSRYLPILVRDGQQYVYDYQTKTAKSLNSFTDEELKERGFSRVDIANPDTENPKFGSEASYYVSNSSEYDYKNNRFPYSTDVFYLLGTYQHTLFACGLDSNNDPIDKGSDIYPAYVELHNKLSSNTFNPWHSINKEDLFEYHLTEVFKSNADLKNKCMESVNYYNDCWEYYKESFDLYDGPDSKTATKFSEKQKYMPGENQCLAYYFSSQLRFLWAATISSDAVLAVTEIDEDIGESGVGALKSLSFLPGLPSAQNIVKSAMDKKYGQSSWFDSSNKYSFLNTWNEMKPLILKRLNGKKDLATFFGHGCVISFDTDLIKLQTHEYPDVAQKLGFEMWESLYDKAIKPFYQKAGTDADRIQYESK